MSKALWLPALLLFMSCAGVNGQVWSPCSRTCGQGTKSISHSNGSVSYDDCSLRDCPKATCAHPHVSRYSVNRHSCCYTESQPSCGFSSNHGKVINGRQSKKQQWPWMVHTRLQSAFSSNELRCGGILISDGWVLTAAHCFHLIPTDWIRLKLGALLVNDSSAFVQSRRVNRTIIHEQYNPVSFRNDIALLQLDLPAEIGEHVRPVCLPQGEEAEADTMCVAAGWGTNKVGVRHIAPTLLEVDLRILPTDFCNQAETPATKPFVEASNICAGAIRGGVDTCQGDSGGPLMCQRCSNCAWFAAGITSFGLFCGQANRPGVYTKISAYETWIQTHTGIGGPARYSSCQGAAWDEWSTCTQSCGTGVQIRSRPCGTACTEYGGQQCPQAANCPCTNCVASAFCTDLHQGGTCAYFAVNQLLCTNPLYANWLKLNCARSCGFCGTGTCQCGPTWSLWKPWTQCSVTCGVGSRWRFRDCNKVVGCGSDYFQAEACNDGPCPEWSAWTGWGDCDCATSQRSRTRTCSVSGACPGLSTMSESCTPVNCPVWRAWETWSPCDVTCGPGQQARIRFCDNGPGCTGHSTETRGCQAGPCPEFGSWSNWSACSKTCGSGETSRSRTCSTGNLCVGAYTETKSCHIKTCQEWSAWTGWGDCDCATSQRSRTRTCSVYGACPGLSTMSESCTPVNCPVWRAWETWSPCDVTCGPGQQARIRFCDNGPGCTGHSTEIRGCQAGPCPVFGPWSTWSTCSKTCGPGETSRSRTCSTGNLCVGAYTETKSCQIKTCQGSWSHWGQWGQCRGNCGSGSQSRSRTCVGGNSCPGSSIQSQACLAPCVTVACGRWGACSRTCGNGTRSKRDCSSGKVAYDDCYDRDCPQKTCPNGFQRRHSVNGHSCCDARNPGSCGVGDGGATDVRQFPWTAQLIINTEVYGPVLCLGVLISESWVLTAAECVQGRKASSFEVFLGTLHSNVQGPQVQRPTVSSTVVHPKFSFPRYDIALLQLSAPVTVGDYVKPICLPQGEDVTSDNMCVVPTWGLRPGRFTRTELMMLDLRILDFDFCEQAYQQSSSKPIESIQVCAGSVQQGVDTCSGDSGGPVMCQRCSTCNWFVGALTSFGPSKCGMPHRPSVYTRVSYFESWIRNATGLSDLRRHGACIV